ncbi:MAG: ATP-sensitive inward rectifier potassium channel 10 [Alphaproteobacteria bacterium]|nr:ATP-sensitive inward rectifier potassium channel 10 [Alphaproteobacteria bacterium]MBV9541146.1 ATP-sensitive inward rectifier potassium channel 10 [Alphaproteobacteria bacterium]MBV9903180.1 ATP-sensitive inward rectifier potassium channel 10 [Alphaproteobacteria bacterium]
MSGPDHKAPPRPSAVSMIKPRQRVAIVKGQDVSRYTDFYHSVLIAPWWLFFLGLVAFFVVINVIFALLYLADPNALAHAQRGNFWDAFLFSVQTIGSVNYTAFVPQTIYANVIVSIEAFFGILTIALFTGIIFARFSRPFARIVFSNKAVIIPFDGMPTLMFRSANQRGNSIVDAEVRIYFAWQQTTREGIVMRRFEEMKPARQKSSLFVLSWTIMHQIDRSSPLYGITIDQMYERQVEIVVMLSGLDETLADRVYARYSYGPDAIVMGEKFVDVISVDGHGRRVVDLTRFHDTEPLAT